MRSALEPVPSKVLIWLSRRCCASHGPRATIGVGLSFPRTRTSGICALQGTVLCCRRHMPRCDALAPRFQCQRQTYACPPPQASWCATTHSGTGVEPVTARFNVWCSASELTLAADAAFFRTQSRNTRAAIASHQGRAAVRRWNWPNQPRLNLLSDFVQRRRRESNPL